MLPQANLPQPRDGARAVALLFAPSPAPPAEQPEQQPAIADPLPPPPVPDTPMVEVPVAEPLPAPRPPPVRRAVAARPRAAPTPPPSPTHTETPLPGAPGLSNSDPIIPPRPVAGMETNAAPIYPESARRRGEQGRVTLRVNVSDTGTPTEVDVQTTSGHPSLDEAAQTAVRRWRFIPAMQTGRPIAAVAEVPIRFRLEN